MTPSNNRVTTFVLRALVLAIGITMHSAAYAVVAPLFYDPATGNVAFDLTDSHGGLVRGYTFYSDDAFDLNEFSPILNTPVVTTLVGQLAEATIPGVPAGVYTLGNVLPAGLSETEVSDLIDFTRSRWTGAAGGSLESFGLVYGPSPFPALNDPNAPPPVFDWAAEATLIYNSVTGNVTLDSTGSQGGSIAAYTLDSNSASFHADAFMPAIVGNTVLTNSSRILEANYGGIPTGIYDLGPILDPGFDLDSLQSHLTSAKFLTAPGHGAEDFDIETNGVGFTLRIAAAAAPVPEPSTYLLAAFGLIGLITGHNRRKTRSRQN